MENKLPNLFRTAPNDSGQANFQDFGAGIALVVPHPDGNDAYYATPAIDESELVYPRQLTPFESYHDPSYHGTFNVKQGLNNLSIQQQDRHWKQIDFNVAATTSIGVPGQSHLQYAPEGQMGHINFGLYACEHVQCSPDSSSNREHGGVPLVPGHQLYTQVSTSTPPVSQPNPGQVLSPTPGDSWPRCRRRRPEEIERKYRCRWEDCEKAYGTLNHLNAHITIKGHGEKRHKQKVAKSKARTRRHRVAIP